jgi:hypothetical protein
MHPKPTGDRRPLIGTTGRPGAGGTAPMATGRTEADVNSRRGWAVAAAAALVVVAAVGIGWVAAVARAARDERAGPCGPAPSSCHPYDGVAPVMVS